MNVVLGLLQPLLKPFLKKFFDDAVKPLIAKAESGLPDVIGPVVTQVTLDIEKAIDDFLS